MASRLIRSSVLALGTAVGAAHGAAIFVSGDTNITHGLTGSFGQPIDPGNQQFFENVLQGGSSVVVLLSSHAGSVDLADTDLVTFYNSLVGVTATLISGTVTDANLAGADLFLAPLPDDNFTGGEIAAMSNFLDAGGSIFLTGENASFAAENTFVNNALVALGSDMEVFGSTFDKGFHTATGDQIADDPFTAGVETFTYAAPSEVALTEGGTILFFGTGGEPFLAYELTGCLTDRSIEVVCHADGTTFTVNVEGLNACTGGTTQVTFTASGGAVGEELCFTVLVDDGGFCCSTEICVTVPDCSASVVIDFDELFDGDVLTNQFPEATFSSSAANVNFIHGHSAELAHTPPNFICTGPAGGSINCVEDTFVDFTNAVDSLTFWAIGVGDVGTVAEVNVFVGDVFDTTVDIVGLGDQFTPFMVDLSSFSNVTRIELVNITDGAGIGWDTFSFSVMTEPSDLNGDGIVGIEDFLALIAAWGSCSDCGDCAADFDGDCQVSVTDMLILLGNWTA